MFDSKIIPSLNRGGREHYIVEPFEDHRYIFKVTIGPEFGFPDKPCASLLAGEESVNIFNNDFRVPDPVAETR